MDKHVLGQEKLHNMLRARRAELGHSIPSFCQARNIPPDTVERVESGDFALRWGEKKMVFDAYGIREDTILKDRFEELYFLQKLPKKPFIKKIPDTVQIRLTEEKRGK